MALLSRAQRTKWINWYPPYIGAGVKLLELDENFTSCKVRMKLTWWNKNIVGTHFGGSLYSMCDPWYMLLLLQTMDKQSYIIWDKAASIRFKAPGKGTVYASFEIQMSQVEQMRAEVAAAGGRKDFTFQTKVVDEQGKTIATVEKLIYVKKK